MKNTLEKIMGYLKNVLNDCVLFVKRPIPYLYLFSLSSKDRITIYPYEAEVGKYGRQLAIQVQKLVPSLKVHFVGSAALGLPGQKDIDLLIECTPAKFNESVSALATLIGNPNNSTDAYREWNIKRDGYMIDVFIAEPSNRIFDAIFQAYNLLSRDKVLFEKYKQLKLISNNLSIREYQKRRLAFFTEVGL